MRITAEDLKTLLHYNKTTGAFTWLVKRGKMYAGDSAGCARPDGYVKITINYTQYLAHQLAHLYMTGEWCDLLDHIDRNPNNNAWKNLRPATYALNAINTDLRADNTSGVKGVGWDRKNKKWLSQICRNGHTRNLGRYVEFNDAVKARKRAEKVAK